MQYERRRYTKAIGDDDPAQVLPKTKLWLQAGFRKVHSSLFLHLDHPFSVTSPVALAKAEVNFKGHRLPA